MASRAIRYLCGIILAKYSVQGTMMGKSSHNDGRLFVISGPSGAGKGTICEIA